MPTRRSALGLVAAPILAAPFIGAAMRPARAAEPAWFMPEPPVAIHGTDPVAYFTEGRPVPGRADLAHTHDGATWRFATAEARDRFAADPETYAPVFGGYCAFAASRGYLAPTIPEAWTVHEGRLYLNANLRARELWLAELPGVIPQGHANWPAILG